MSCEERMETSSDLVVPEMMLRVLLVEADDSTRQIITALLKKCSYIVSAVSDGLKAWETLNEKPHSIDLVLTEVDLPSISGFSLLTLVMEHEFCKHIPVIMMSSQDSISMVLKCMLRGAADFLIKPVRRNELRNLWQHVWRRQMLAAGHVLQNLSDGLHKADATSENNSASNPSSDYSTSMHKNKECSEKGNDSQGLSQLKCRNASNLSNTYIEQHGECINLDEESHMPESETGVKSYGLGSEEDRACVTFMTQDEGVEPESDIGNANIHRGIRGCNDEPVEHSSGAIDLIGTFDNPLKSTYGHSNYNNGINKFEYSPQLELSLRRFCPSSSMNQGSEERHTLNRSNASAFSWYNNGRALQPLFTALASNSTELKEGAIESHELLSNHHSENTFRTSQPHGPIMSNSQENMTTLVIGQSGQAELALPSPQLGLTSVPGLRFDDISAGCGPVIPPVYYSQSGLPPAWSPKFTCQQEQSSFPMSISIHSNAENYDSENGYHRSDETTNHSVEQNVDDQKNMEPVEDRHNSPAAGQSVSSSLRNGVTNHNSSNSYGRICSGSEKNGTLVAAVEKATAPGNFKDGGIFIPDGFRGMDSYHSSQREAALTKFRLKRKDRCYEKKVRYQSRKKLAEQRPRVKGQFVRQAQSDTQVVNAVGCP